MQKLFKKFFLFIRNPLTGFIFYIICVSIFLLIPPGKEGLISFFLLLPFILFAIIGLNLSFFSTLFGRFTLSEAKKRNHPLEHGTIHFLKKLHGNKLRVGGRAEKDGFRICGVKKKNDVSEAFEQLVKEMQNPNPALVLALRCGSNIIPEFCTKILTLTLPTHTIFHISSKSKLITIGLSFHWIWKR